MEIKIIGAGCDTCGKLYDNACQAVKELGLDAKVEKVEDLVEIVKMGIMAAPAMVVDGKTVVSGQVPGVKSLVKLLKKL